MKKLAILMSVVMLVAVTTSAALAGSGSPAQMKKVQMMTGQVVKVDAVKGDVVIKVGKKDETLKAEPKMLTGITAGEKVRFEKSGNTLKSIKAAEAPKIEAPAKKKTQ